MEEVGEGEEGTRDAPTRDNRLSLLRDTSCKPSLPPPSPPPIAEFRFRQSETPVHFIVRPSDSPVFESSPVRKSLRSPIVVVTIPPSLPRAFRLSWLDATIFRVRLPARRRGLRFGILARERRVKAALDRSRATDNHGSRILPGNR